MLSIALLSAAMCPQAPSGSPQFHDPVRMKSPSGYVKVEQPGYAAPAWHDVNGDGKKDLVVGQFADGKMQVFAGLGGGKLGKGDWLQAEGDVAQVPGVW